MIHLEFSLEHNNSQSLPTQEGQLTEALIVAAIAQAFAETF